MDYNTGTRRIEQPNLGKLHRAMVGVWGLQPDEYVIPFQVSIGEKSIKRIDRNFADIYLKCLVSRDGHPKVLVIWYSGDEWKNFLVEARDYSL